MCKDLKIRYVDILRYTLSQSSCTLQRQCFSYGQSKAAKSSGCDE